MDDQELTTPDNAEETPEQKSGEDISGINFAADFPLTKGHTPEALEAIYDVQIQISAVLGKATMPVKQLLKLSRGAVIELDRHVGEAIDIYVNNRLVARGEVVVVNEKLGVTLTEIIKSDHS
ncbi:MAG: flagellar motor switch protein FliN [Alphaproteobacteria bacterium]|nr:flagellar motor switch protein FliN [Alphaproteobacteria bacterium]